MHQLRVGNAFKTDDPRDPLQKMRRKELQAVLAHQGLAHPPGIGAEAARTILRSHGVDGRQYVGPRGQFVWPHKVEDDVELEANKDGRSKKIVGAQELEKMKIYDIRRLCTRAGIKWSPRDKKVDLIEQLTRALE